MYGRYEPSMFTVEHQGRSPLVYNRSGDIQRLALVDPNAPPPGKHDSYFAETQRKILYGKNGHRLKNPRIEVNPGVAPGTVAFLDYHAYGPGGVYVDYMKTRQDYRGRGLARRLVDELVTRHPDLTHLHFGKMMHPTIGKIHDELTDRLRGKVSISGHKDY